MDKNHIFTTLRDQLFRGKNSSKARFIHRKIREMKSFDGSNQVEIEPFFKIFLDMGLEISQKEVDAWLFENDPEQRGIVNYRAFLENLIVYY